tara:strand:- start:437 stop:760 length:324 start_codon:yes stop_codon:yes gene_type:complete
MNQLQREKLAKALIDQAYTCSEKGHHDDAESLIKQSIKVRFHDEIEQIVKGDFVGKKVLDIFIKMQFDIDEDKKLMARSLINVLMKDERFLRIYNPVYKEIQNEEEN